LLVYPYRGARGIIMKLPSGFGSNEYFEGKKT